MSATTATVSSERPSWPGLPPTLGLKEFFGSLSRADDLYYTSEPEPIPNNRFWTTEQRALRKRRDGVETTTPTREQLGEAILRRNIVVQPKTGEDAYARTQTIVPDGASNMVLITCLSEQGKPEIYVALVSHARAGVLLYTGEEGVFKGLLSLEASSGFVEKGETAEQAQMHESREELGLPFKERHILSRDRPLTTAPALTAIYHQHSTSWYLFKGTINELVRQSGIRTSRGEASLVCDDEELELTGQSEIKTLQQAHFMTIQDLCSLFKQKVDNRFTISEAVMSLHRLVTMYSRCNSIPDMQTLSEEKRSNLAFDIPKLLSDGTGDTAKLDWAEVRNGFLQGIKKSKEPSKESRDSRL